MNKVTGCCAFFCLLFSLSFGQNRDEIAVRKLLAAQTKEWNSGNIKGYMATYWTSDSLLFIGKSGVTHGWQQTLDNYEKHYPDTAAMGKLDFELVSVKRLSPVYFFVIGKWRLLRSMGDLSGAFTLLLRKINNKWVIVADHSS
ncbi:MAG: L-asparaginase [Ferruginibacter sp.]|nr:L-asparaginase [Ferruginibacter sp.]